MLLNNYLGIASLLSAFISILVAGYATRKDKIPNQFIIFIFFLIIWTLATAFSFFSKNISLRQFWFSLETASSAFFVYFWMVFIIEYALNLTSQSRKILNWIILIPFLISLAILTNSFHHLLWLKSYNAQGMLAHLNLNSGPLYNYLFLPYSFIAAGFSVVVLVDRFFRVAKHLKRQIALLILASFIPGLSVAMFLTSFRDSTQIPVDYTPYAILLSSLIVASILLKSESFKHLPIMARNLFESISNAVFMLDANALIVDYNQGAHEFIDALNMNHKGINNKSIFDIIPNLINSDDLFSDEEINIYDTGVADSYYDINILPVKKGKKNIIGYAIIIKDVSTHHKDLQRINRLSEFRKSLLDLHTNLLNNDNLDNLYLYIIEHAILLIPEAEAGSVLIRGDDNRYRFKAVVGYDMSQLRDISLAYDELLYVKEKDKNNYVIKNLSKYSEQELSGDEHAVLHGIKKELKATLAIPIYIKDKLIAIFHLDNRTDENAFDHEIEQMAEVFSNHIAETINRSILKKEINGLARYSNAMISLNSKLLDQESYKNYYDLLLARAESVLELAIATIPNAEYGSFLLKQDDAKFYFKAAVGFDMNVLKDLYLSYEELACSGVRKSIYTKSNIGQFSEQMLDKDRLERLQKAGRLSEIKSTIALPIFLNDNLVAVFNLDNTKLENAFDKRTTLLAEAFANHMGDLIYKVNLQKEIDSLDLFRESMLELSTKLLGQDSEAKFYQLLLSKAIEVLPKTEFASVLELKEDGKFHITANYGYDLRIIKSTSLRISELPEELQDKTISSFAVDDISNFIKHSEAVKALFVPIKVEDEVKAVLIIASTQGHYLLQKQSQQFAEVFASHVAAMLKRRQVEYDLQQGKLIDNLTGLPNRKPLLDRLQHVLGLSWRNNSDFAVLFLEIDKFENISSSYGHLVADTLIKYIAKRLEHSLRPGDTVSRWGNNQFAILLERLDSKEEAIDMVNRLRQIISKSFLIEDIEIMVTMTAGIVFDDKRYEQAEEILQNADITLNRAKTLSLGYMIFKDEMSNEILEQLSLEKDIRKALENNCFHLVYQPIVDIKNYKVTGFEVLLRWKHISKGLISPAKFIPIAEEIGLIIEIDRWVIKNSISQIATWDKNSLYKNDFTISINVSASSFLEANFYEYVNGLLEEYKVDMKRIRLELTEHTIMEDIENVRDILSQFRDKGIKVMIDDFGTGYSSLNYLHKLPLDILKIDMSFIKGLPNEYSQLMVKSIVSLAHNLELKVVAEGLETVEQLKYLQTLGCEYAQGYYYSKPLNALELEHDFLFEDTIISKTKDNKELALET